MRDFLLPKGWRQAIQSTGLLALLGACAAVPTKESESTPPAQEPATSQNAVPASLGAESKPKTQESLAANPLILREGSYELQPSEAQQQAGIPHIRFRVTVDNAPVRGPEDAPITIVMFSDFECPYCKQALQTVSDLEREYEGKIRFAYKALPLDRHPDALIAGLVAHSALAQGKFWEFHDLVFSSYEIEAEQIEAYIQKLGMDSNKVASDLEELRYGAQLQRDIREGDRLDIRSTPTIFVNGRRIDGAKPIQIFRRVIDQELSLISYLKDKGVAPTSVYDELTRHGYDRIELAERARGLYSDRVYPVQVADSPQLGPSNAPLTLVVFADFQCPYCVRGQNTVRKLKKRYGDRLRVVYKHYPLARHHQGALAARASVFAHQHSKFWEFHDRLYDKGPSFSVSDLHSIAADIGLPTEAFNSAIQSEQFDARIQQDMDHGRELGVDGTPLYFLNGRPVAGALPEINFRLLIAEELERVEKLLESGVPADQLYSTLTQAQG